ncbi:hypothetical protein GCM10023237_61220 [Streptomyces coeruleoprunus]
MTGTQTRRSGEEARRVDEEAGEEARRAGEEAVRRRSRRTAVVSFGGGQQDLEQFLGRVPHHVVAGFEGVHLP